MNINSFRGVPEFLEPISNLSSITNMSETAEMRLLELPIFDPLFDLDETSDEVTYHFHEDEPVAAAKPAHAGGGSGGGGGKGSGKNKDTNNTDDTSGEPSEFGNTYTSGLDTPDGFNISIVFEGDGWTDEYRQVVIDAAEYLSDVITSDLPDVQGTDDVQISVSLENMDGTGGFLGLGGVTDARSDSHLPFEGFVQIDIDDAAAGLSTNLYDIVLHEMMHAIGFGTQWGAMGLVDQDGDTTRFTGETATEVYNAEFSDLAEYDDNSHAGVPLSDDDKHWDHLFFRKEVMTDRIYIEGNYLSDLSLAALEDMGYETTLSAPMPEEDLLL